MLVEVVTLSLPKLRDQSKEIVRLPGSFHDFDVSDIEELFEPQNSEFTEEDLLDMVQRNKNSDDVNIDGTQPRTLKLKISNRSLQ